MDVQLVCWSDHTDLTQEFRDAATSGAPPGPVVGLVRVDPKAAPGPPGPAQVMVICPVDGRANMFLADVLEQHASAGQSRVVTGAPLISAYDQDLILAKQLSPDQSLARANDNAKWVVQTVAVVATILGGFGTVSIVSTQPPRHPLLISLTVGFAGFAVLSGVVAMLPWLRTVDPNNPRTVNRFFRDLVLWRGVWCVVASAALVLSVGLAIATVAAVATDGVVPTATLDAGWDGSGTAAILSADATVTHAKSGDTVIVTIGVPAGATPGASLHPALAAATGAISRNGTTEVNLKFVPAATTGPFEVLVTDGTTGATLASVTLSQPPRFITPQANS